MYSQNTYNEICFAVWWARSKCQPWRPPFCYLLYVRFWTQVSPVQWHNEVEQVSSTFCTVCKLQQLECFACINIILGAQLRVHTQYIVAAGARSGAGAGARTEGTAVTNLSWIRSTYAPALEQNRESADTTQAWRHLRHCASHLLIQCRH